MLRKAFSITVCLVAQFVFFSCHGFAAEPVNHVAVLAPFVNDDTLAVAYVDVASLNASDTAELFNLLPKLPEQAQAEMLGMLMISGLAKNFQDAGGQGVYVVAGLEDVCFNGGPVVIATARPGKHPEDVEQMFRDTIRQFAIDSSQAATSGFVLGIDIQRKGDAVLIGMKRTVARYGKLQPAARNDLVAPLTRLTSEGAVAALVFCPGADYRRVSRELWPELPGTLAPLRGELADSWLHIEAAINLPPNPKPRIALQAKDVEAAEVFAKLWRNLPAETTEFGDNSKTKQQVKGYAQLLVDTLPAKVEGTRVEIGVPTEKTDISKLGAMFGKAFDASMESSRRRKRMDRFKNIALAMLNYESANKHFPPAAIRDKEGKPLLSWRVAILPYLEQQDLYRQFHLDEPWDSSHNSMLISKMPAIYADPDASLKQLARDGKTTYQVPVGAATVFYNKEGAKIREIVDGTANTILVVEVEPSRAVEWTKPADWEVDLEHPRHGVERSDREQFLAAWCDGSVQYIPVHANEAHLRAVLTRAGRETAESHF